ncbi:hypothetical protein, partial [Bradyrhizobium sp. TM233]|uniref:hypothetical protein n=1 Tax=Bradyrhizobium sp. TM233 TaxID=2599801 RepID=UPI0030C6E312
VQVDLLRACNDETTACELEHKVWAAVADETASAVRYGLKVHALIMLMSQDAIFMKNNCKQFIAAGIFFKVKLGGFLLQLWLLMIEFCLS